MAESRLQQLSDAGVSVWIDSLSREMLDSGELASLIADDSVVGVTSNPTIFQKALAEGDLYDEQLREVAAQIDDPVEIFFALAQEDIKAACDLMRPVWERTNGVDGFVSLEVDPTLAYDRERTFEQAVRFNKDVDRPNLYVKIPATEPGLGAIEDCIAKGVPINVTLIFSLERYAAVVESYLRGLERLVASGGDPRKVISVASFFVSRVDTEADKRLEAIGRQDLQGKLAIANAKLAYEHYLEVVRQRPLGLPRGEGRADAAVPVGVDLDEEPLLPRRALRRGADRPRHRQHDAARDGPRLPGPRRGEDGQPHRRASTRRRRSSPTWPRPGSTTTTSSRRWRPRACRSSPTPSRSCWTGSGRRSARCSRRDRGRQPAARRPAAAAAPGAVRGRHLRRLRRPDEAEADPRPLRARLPQAAAGAVCDRRRRPLAAELGAVRGRDEEGGQGVRARPVPAGRLGLARGRDALRRHRVRRTRRARIASARVLEELDAERGTGGNRLYYLAVPPQAFTDAVTEIGERRDKEGWVRLIVEKPFGHDLDSARKLNELAAPVVPGGRDLPHRPLPRQGDGAEHAGAALRERHLRADLEPAVHRPRPDHGRRVDGDRGAGRLLRVRRARSATSSRTTSCSCSRSPPWSRRSTSPPTRCATRR